MEKLKYSLLFFIFILFYYQNLFSQGWFLQNSSTSEDLNDIFCINSTTCWVVGDNGIILHTGNGGTNWIQQNNPGNIHLLSVFFTNENTGYAVGNSPTGFPFCLDYNIIVKTTNGGTNWLVVSSGSSNDRFKEVSAVNSSISVLTSFGTNSYCMGSDGGIYISQNGSAWSKINSGEIFWGYSTVNFINSLTGYAMGFYTTDVMSYWIRVFRKSTDGGLNWSAVIRDTTLNSPSEVTPSFRKMRFLNINTGYAIDNLLKRTTNGGINWAVIDSANTSYCQSSYFRNFDTGWISVSNKILRTNNAGLNWTEQVLQMPAYINTLKFIDNNTGWAVGAGGIILKTTTGGLTNILKISIEIPDTYSLSQNYPNPFNPVTKIKFSIPAHHPNGAQVTLKIFDILGREVMTLVNEPLQAGVYETTFDGSAFSSGIYFYRLNTDKYTETRKMILLK